MSVNNKNFDSNTALIEKIRDLRRRTLLKKQQYSIAQLEKPVSFWIKEDRLLNEIGKEFTIILRTKGCCWALGQTGGCSMCGYVQDANIGTVSPNQIKNQFNHALQSKLEEIERDNNNYVIKIFNSGSFFDENEIADSARHYIYEQLAEIKQIKEIIVESRVEFINSEKLEEIRKILKNKYIEIGIGLETVDDYIRNEYINKGINYDEFLKVFNLCKQNNIGVKAYLLFKPPFLNEQGAIDDCSTSIQDLLKLRVNTVSINPVNIQKGSLVEYLWYQNRYRPPWFYSLIQCLKKSIRQKDLETTRILSDPSGAGTKRGIHNCLRRECNENMKKILKKFVLNQDMEELKKKKYECNCKKLYQFQKNHI